MANILVVDDELGIRDLLSEILNDEGHQVELAGICYHVGENDMSFWPYRKDAAKWAEVIRRAGIKPDQ